MKYFESRQKFVLANKDNLICFYCGEKVVDYKSDAKKADRLTIDHIKPIGMGGDPYDHANFRICCGGCNSARGRIQCYIDINKKYERMMKYVKGKGSNFPEEFYHYIFFSPLQAQ